MTLPHNVADALLTGTADDVHDAIIVTDADGLPVAANEAFEKLSGLSLDEMTGCSSPHRLEAGRASTEATSLLLKALQKRQPLKTQVLSRTAQGPTAWFDLEISPLFNSSSSISGFVAIQRDISSFVERSCGATRDAPGESKAEGRLQAAVAALSDGFAIFDDHDRLLTANEAFFRIHRGAEDGARPGASFEELLRCTAAGCLADLAGEEPEPWIAQQLRLAALPSSEVHLRYRHGGWMSRRHKRMENGETVRIWTSINSLKHQQTELEEARARAERADRAKSQFLTTMSHEIRTPVNGIIGFSHLLHLTDLTERQKEYASLIQSSANALASLIDELLDLSKIERGALEIEAFPFKLSELIAAARSLEVLAASKSLTLEIECTLPDDTAFAGDLKRIRQILINLIGNAIKFTESGHVRLSIRRENNGLSFAVSDTGRGIARDRQRAIFERFYRAGGSGLANVQGSGLGLSIVKDLAELMGGEIAVASEPGLGSTFKVWLPLCPLVEKTPEAPRKQSAASAVTKPGGLDTYKVLVAEDHPINLKLALALLQAAGCTADSAENGRQALVMLENGPYDLVIMDSHMPVMSGIEAIRMIRRRPDWKSQIPILSLTADAMAGAETYHAMAGADLYMAKPLKSDCFISAVRHLAGRGRCLREKNGALAALESNTPRKCA